MDASTCEGRSRLERSLPAFPEEELIGAVEDGEEEYQRLALAHRRLAGFVADAIELSLDGVLGLDSDFADVEFSDLHELAETGTALLRAEAKGVTDA